MEFRDSEGPRFHNAHFAWQQGSTGSGVTIAVIDTGIDMDSPEFAGRIHPDSTDVAGGNRGAQASDDHGTNVAMTAAAARNGEGILGIAWGATILALRADTPGTCVADGPQTGSDDCSFDDPSIAAGIDLAVASGARVINLSLGGGSASRVVTRAVTRAVEAGVVVIVSAGNDGDSRSPGIDPNNPDPFAQGLANAGDGGVIIVGSVDDAGVISSFSNRAGTFGAQYLSARGEAICCTYEDGEIYVDGQGYVYLFSGTSFAAPQVAGAVALLAQAFPNLTGQEIVEILLTSAHDVGAVGTDRIYGTGIMDIAAAFQPIGRTTMAGTQTAMPLGDTTAIGSPAMGDALSGQTLSGVVLDKYKRAYNVNFGSTMRGADLTQKLRMAVGSKIRSVSAGDGKTAVAFNIAAGEDQRQPWVGALRLTEEDSAAARVLAARVAMKLSPDTQMGFAFSEGADGLVAQMQGQDRPAFMIAQGGTGDAGFIESSDISLALRHQLGGTGLTISAQSGEAFAGARGYVAAEGYREQIADPVRSFGLAADRQLGPVATALGLTWMQEDRTVLGGRFHEAFGADGGANSLFLDAQAGMALDTGWRLNGSMRHGLTMPEARGLIAGGARVRSSAWSMDVSRADVLGQGDSIALRISQPLRVESGDLTVNLPVAYDYATLSTQFGQRSINLAPSGREIVGELAWRGPVASGTGAASVFYRRQPGHYAALPADQGIALRWNKAF
jgi:hypothetical protein